LGFGDLHVFDPSHWSDLQQQTLACYDEALLRQVAARLVKPRNQWPVEDLLERAAAVLGNPAVIDRRLQDLTPASRQVLALIGHSRQPCWNLGNLVELAIALGHSDGLQPVLALLEAGLLYPRLDAHVSSTGRNGTPSRKIKSFEQWMASPGPAGLLVFSPPQIASRAIGEDFGLPDLSQESGGRSQGAGVGGQESGVGDRLLTPDSRLLTPIREVDGLEWLLRLAVLWQQVADAPLRRTQQGGFFKRDLERLEQDALLNAPPADHLVDVPDAAFLTIALAELEGMVEEVEGELRAGTLPATWDNGLASVLESLWIDLPRLSTWNPLDGWRGGEAPAGNPFPSAYLLAFLLLARLPEGASVRTATIEQWLVEQHPYWASESLRPSRQKPWLETFLLGVAYQLRLVQAQRGEDGDWQVRLTPLGRWLLGLGETPALETVHAQTLLVQPNLQILAYRQGLTSSLIARLTQFAKWENLGAACTLQLQPETVYRALEAGQSFESIRLTLEQHGTRGVPPAVLDSLRTWANKRDRITVYPAATLLEFSSADDLNEALARGLPAIRIADTLALVASEENIEFRHFRLTGTRDYALPPEKCVSVEPDGVTLTLDLARSDLLLETEVPRFAERLGGTSANGRRQYRLTPASLLAGRSSGLTLPTLETWFQQRAGQSLPAAARLLMTAGQGMPPRLQRHLVLHVATPELADGLMQWPETRALVEERLGPTALVVSEENAKRLRERLDAAGITLAES
jgi:hypothetical protein